MRIYGFYLAHLHWQRSVQGRLALAHLHLMHTALHEHFTSSLQDLATSGLRVTLVSRSHPLSSIQTQVDTVYVLAFVATCPNYSLMDAPLNIRKEHLL